MLHFTILLLALLVTLNRVEIHRTKRTIERRLSAYTGVHDEKTNV